MNSETAGKVIKCRAAICWAPLKPLTVEDIEVEPPKAGEVRIKVITNSVCHTDLHVYEGKFKENKYPCILGHEATGVVESIGDGVSSVVPGDYVITFFIGGCGECVSCKNPNTNVCLKRRFDETTLADGTSRFKFNGQTIYQFFGTSALSEYTVISEIKVAKINPKARMDRACVFACGFSSGYGAVVNTANAEANSSVAIWGMGAVGLSAVYGAKSCKATTIIAIDTNKDKSEAAKKMGSTHFLNPLKCKEENKSVAQAVKELTSGIGVDYAIECVGDAVCTKEALDSTAPWGTTVVVGMCSAEQKLEINPNDFLTGKKLTGSPFGGYKSKDSVTLLINKYIDGKLNIEPLFTGSVELDQINEAFNRLIDGKALRTVVLFK
ncbi:alcohol dehydrogenase class-3-like protein [Dinothrombium tinctorium]|uniref:Alcohol dehydrogenase class-3-like protein n=1 Tax=Dinothrombium tinctorium TaxID=1965070 RepID=A0A3S3P063_9ACAR|nr:alcohol dehydrogenase class-3-like protein [Dinothrombium tinctorium]RWR99582.1 alcohol dehydrogenase class-3-like protein [Dinothrombium tinctorium]RWS00382.1 alcohol dehydrogenase class-3-like protein [Dinothrombium tinctorium]RWS02187.1 alcohol dehydrogenase class-3-like protein [Dinothrombium tinctorium]